MDESRKQFAEAFEELTGWELEEYPNQDYADTCWEFWRKSRAAIEIELPESFTMHSGRTQYLYVSEVQSAIRAAGIKVKE
ncbi:TPA: hypothetical protein R8E91_004229 [Escherichia coli]|uniref:hypothetical protein n=1 Tax=Escherichia coli TaxID=562 RepID=UPI0005423A17|nr:hypothetical protein [Escherichia coli]EEQ1625083.1 hypothetical protein [Escherichia coli]EEQ3669381.1 hypothetical protein [Escherichia coli]EEQ7740303.1 hypothetical protein [Escherichia coli]EEX8877792.1 hypothetical protein [Escherichia coli]EFB6367486.1 hypothetical protein [Escherichia coli]